MTTNSGLSKFVVWAPDYAGPEAQERRLAVRARHLENARQLIKDGVLREWRQLASYENHQLIGGHRNWWRCLDLRFCQRGPRGSKVFWFLSHYRGGELGNRSRAYRERYLLHDQRGTYSSFGCIDLF